MASAPFAKEVEKMDTLEVCVVQVIISTDLVLNVLDVSSVPATSAHGSHETGALDMVARIWKAVPGDEAVHVRMREVLMQYPEMFPLDLPEGLPPDRGEISEAIRLEPGARPTMRPMYRYSPAEKAEMEKQVNYLLSKGLCDGVSTQSSPFTYYSSLRDYCGPFWLLESVGQLIRS